MRIAMIGCKGVPASMSTGGGVERHVEELAPRLAKLGHSVHVYVRPYTNPRRRRLWNGCKLITIPTIRRKNLEAIIHGFLSTLHALRQSYDVIHYHGVGHATLAWIPRIFAPRTRVVVTFHSRDMLHEKWSLFARLYLAWGEWAAIRFPHGTIAISHVIQTYCEKLFGKRPFFIPNGVEIPRKNIGFHELERFHLRPNGYFLGLGRLIPVKAYEVAIEAFMQTPTAMDFVIVGAPGYDVRYAEKLYAMAERDKRIHMLGFQTGEALQQLLTHCYALIHPSRVEGLSVAILEAMAHGKVVVMSDIPANLELIDHSGISFPADNVRALSETLAWVSQDESLMQERGERARAYVRELYNWDQIAKKTEVVYSALQSEYQSRKYAFTYAR